MPALLLIGNHGLEERVDGESHLIPEAIASLPRLEQTAAALRSVELPSGVRIERKRATIAVHFRQSREPDSTMRRLDAVLEPIARDHGLELRRGRLVFELRPPIRVDKGAVLERVTARIRPQSVIYAGDDRTDADAFAALRRMAARGIKTLSVGVASAEVGSELFTNCDLVVDGVDGVVAFLQELLSSLDS